MVQVQHPSMHQLFSFDQNNSVTEESQVEASSMQWYSHSYSKLVSIQVLNLNVFINESMVMIFDVQDDLTNLEAIHEHF
jgi:hypothetical protein